MQFERDESGAEVGKCGEGTDDGSQNVKDELHGSSSSLADSSSSSSSFQDDDDDDSLELSESESITDVTPLNSPYCDSPMPQVNRHQLEASRSIESQEPVGNEGEMNVLMQAIEKLEVEKSRRVRKHRGSDSTSGSRRAEPEKRLLFKQAIAQRNRAKKVSHDRLCRRSTVINRYKISLDADSPVPAEDTPSMEANVGKFSRKQKCLSHPSCQPYPYSLPDNQHPCGLASKTILQRPNASAEPATDIESEMIAH